MDKISVIIPIYNVEKYLEECIKSVVNQTYKNLEIILVNDGSLDESEKIIDKYYKKDSRIKVITKENKGLSSARNEGIRQATGEYILHVDGDDYISNCCCEQLIRRAKSENLDIVIGDIRIFDNIKEKYWQDSDLGTNVIDGKLFLKKYYFVGKATNAIWNKLIKKELYINEGIFHPLDISLGEDAATLSRILLKAKRVGKIDVIIYNYRNNLQSMTKNKNKNILEYKKAFEIVKNYFYMNNENFFFDLYSISFLNNLYYSEILQVPYKIAKKESMDFYLEAWKDFELNCSKMTKDKVLKKNISKKRNFLITIYGLNKNLGHLLNFWWRKISKSFEIFNSKRLNKKL